MSAIIVVDQGNKRIKVLDACSLTVVRCIELPRNCFGCAVVAYNNTILISDYESHTIMVLDAVSGIMIRTIGSGRGSGPGQMDCPSFMSVYAPSSSQSEHHLLLVSDCTNNRICVFNISTGEYLRDIGRDEMAGPRGIALWTPSNGSAADTLVLVSDGDNHRVAIFNLMTGLFVRSIGGWEGSDSGELDRPRGLAVYHSPGTPDEEAVIAVVEWGNHRVQVFRLLDGVFLRVLGSGRGSTSQQFLFPFDVSIAHNQAIITDINNHRLQIFDIVSGNHTMSVGSGEGAVAILKF